MEAPGPQQSPRQDMARPDDRRSSMSSSNRPFIPPPPSPPRQRASLPPPPSPPRSREHSGLPLPPSPRPRDVRGPLPPSPRAAIPLPPSPRGASAAWDPSVYERTGRLPPPPTYNGPEPRSFIEARNSRPDPPQPGHKPHFLPPPPPSRYSLERSSLPPPPQRPTDYKVSSLKYTNKAPSKTSALPPPPPPPRRENPMSMMNLLSDDPPKPTQSSPKVEQSAPRKISRSSIGSAPHPKEEVIEKDAPPKPLYKTISALPVGPPGLTVTGTERAYLEILAQELSDIEDEEPAYVTDKKDWQHRSKKRTLELIVAENGKRKRRRLNLMRKWHDQFAAAAEAERTAFIEAHEQQIEQEVRAREVEEDKERKKDQQRKRRREKAIADEKIKREEAMRNLDAIDDEKERSRLEKEVERASKKIRDTEMRLAGIMPSKETRAESPHTAGRREREVVMDGGLMTSFNASRDDAAAGRRGGRGANNMRARKSKEQKQAEKDSAARGQAILDQGQDLPALAPKEAERLRGYADLDDDSDDMSDMTPAYDRPTAGLTGMAKFDSKGYNQIYEQITKDIARAVPKVVRIKNSSLDTKQSNARKTAQLAAKEARRWQLRTNKSTKDVAARAKRAMREMIGFWKRNERDEREGRKAAERAALDKARQAEAEREANRQKRKLNFLISQTELYSHFIGKKVKTDEIEKHGNDEVAISTKTVSDNENAEHTIDPTDTIGKVAAKVTNFEDLDFDDEDALREAAMANAQNAIQEAQDRARAFNKPDDGGALSQAQQDFDEGEMNFQNPTSLQSMDVAQPKMLTCQLKEYQLKGLNWLVNLYEQGINGILADEMGLGKTVQSISVMAYLAEVHNIWGPFLVIAPASTLHNWQQEITKFVPTIKVLPYWGNAKDRKILRKFWDRKHVTYTRDSPFHVLVTSYQLVVQDTPYFQKIKWQYMILDEAQAIKSSQSSRWKALLGFHCRNRLLLTGTPIQNNMQELWALLHFIMPSLFDSHDEFSEWFSKDIENHAQSNTKLNEDQLRRLHMILKPFMLRRVKKHVQKELGDKIELDVYCDLTYRQRAIYTMLRNKISILDLIEKAAVGDDQDTATLMNLVMQFRKVCNHPDLFERADTWSPLSISDFAETASFMREGFNINVPYSVRNSIDYWQPKLLGEESGRLDIGGPGNDKAGWLQRALRTDLDLWNENNIRESERLNGAFSWLRFIDQSPSDVAAKAKQGLLERAVDLAAVHKPAQALDDEKPFVPVHSMLNIVQAKRQPLVELDTNSNIAGLLDVTRNASARIGYDVIEACYLPKVSAPPVELVCASQKASAVKEEDFFNVPLRRALYPITPGTENALLQSRLPVSKFPVTNLLPAPGSQKQRYTSVRVPSMRRFVTDSGKLARLDRLLRELKEGGHRVLLYFQMTRMIDLMEEYLTYRNYKYCRLDGSTKLEDRRDTVAAFQSSPEIFVFLLSTRAGGLGINLTSADTVIFYDSDWNPTIDSQAMDRAHRLGQTRQVTVYRLITRGTIEERIRKRALQKEEVQRVVISGQAGGDRVVDFNNRSRENNRTKDIAMWLADDDEAAAIEKREQEVLEQEAKEGGKKKRKAPGGKRNQVSMDDMYHEGEGKFDDGPSAEASGAATPMSMDGPPLKKRKGISKKAKTMKQRLAVVDGEDG